VARRASRTPSLRRTRQTARSSPPCDRSRTLRRRRALAVAPPRSHPRSPARSARPRSTPCPRARRGESLRAGRNTPHTGLGSRARRPPSAVPCRSPSAPEPARRGRRPPRARRRATRGPCGVSRARSASSLPPHSLVREDHAVLGDVAIPLLHERREHLGLLLRDIHLLGAV